MNNQTAALRKYELFKSKEKQNTVKTFAQVLLLKQYM